MKLSDVDILSRMRSGSIRIEPPIPDANVGSCSLDLRLGNHFRIFKGSVRPFIDLAGTESAYAMSEDLMEDMVLDHQGVFFLQPGELALGITKERIEMPDDLAGWLNGRSSLARLGLMVDITAHLIDPGFHGHITLEFVNLGRLPLALRPGMRICAIGFESLSTPTSRPYYAKHGAKYHEQKSPLQSQIHRE
jgi:dCTP deaminase